MRVGSKTLAELPELEALRISVCTNTCQKNCSKGLSMRAGASAQWITVGFTPDLETNWPVVFQLQV